MMISGSNPVKIVDYVELLLVCAVILLIFNIICYIKNRKIDTEVSKKYKKRIIRFLFVLGFIPLLFTPGVLIANIMALASAYKTEGYIQTYLFVGYNSAYLVVYIV